MLRAECIDAFNTFIAYAPLNRWQRSSTVDTDGDCTGELDACHVDTEILILRNTRSAEIQGNIERGLGPGNPTSQAE